MESNEQILRTEEFVKENMKGYDSGHDWYHIERVRSLALYINRKENQLDPFIVEITALLHDIADSKFSPGNSESGYSLIAGHLDACGLSGIKERVLKVIKGVSFSSNRFNKAMADPLLWVIQDADRLDAIGAIGVARAFNYGGFRNNAIYVPPDETGLLAKSTVAHFYEKLLKLKDMMNTPTARQLAMERHQFLEVFLSKFYDEWEFGTV